MSSESRTLRGPAECPSFLASLRATASDIKLAHSVFALPFALLASFMAATHSGAVEWRRFVGQLILIVICMIFARTSAMLANRILDHKIDRDNPRTAGRAIPSGRLPLTTAIAIWTVSAGLFLAGCAGFGVFYANWWPLVLAVPVLAWICGYGLLKRFTWWCHLYLGSSLAMSPLAATIAIAPEALAAGAVWLLALMVLCWVAGFDVIYALQDVEVDRKQGLHSMPSRLGETRAMMISRALHVSAVLSLVGVIVVDERFAWFFGVGVTMVVMLLLWEHLTVARWGTTRMALAFFTLNGVISCVLGGLGIADVLVSVAGRAGPIA